MTIRDKNELLKLLSLFNKEELDCSENCHSCYYNTMSPYKQDCPILLAFDLIKTKFTNTLLWEERKG